MKGWKKISKFIWKKRRLAILAPTVAGFVILLRMAGLLQVLELSALDRLFLMRPVEEPDSRIVIVGIDEEDLNALGTWPIPDIILAQLLQKIKQQEPRAIGLDIYRDLPVPPGYEELVKVFETTPNLIGIRKVVGDETQHAIAPPPILASLGQVSANDFPWDVDSKIRRSLLYLEDEEGNTVFSLGFRLAMIYLEAEGIKPQMKDEIKIQLGKAVFSPFEGNDGGYVGAEDGGYQELLNYRGPQQSFTIVSLMDVLEEQVDPDLMRDRIVFIGSTATSLKDYLLTPYSTTLFGIPQPMAGVEIHANITSQFISGALEGRPTIQTWPEGIEWGWILLWAAIGTTFTCRWRDVKGLPHISFSRTTARMSLASAILIGICYAAFIRAWWIPLVPPLMALSGAAIATIVYTLVEKLKLSYKQIEEYSRTLEIKVEERTHELKLKNDQLKETLQQLKAAQTQMIAQEKLASLGSLAAGIAHEIRNPLNFVNNFAGISVELTEEVIEELENQAENLAAEDVEYMNETLTDLKDSVADIKHHGERIEKIVEGMLLLSHSDSGTRSPTDLNGLLDEAIQLAYHRVFAQDSSFEIAIATDYQEAIGEVELVAQDMNRALLNILNNAFDAVYEKKKTLGSEFHPQLQVTTRQSGDRHSPRNIEIRIRDNGSGIPEDIRDKIFNPFFTTKPPGEGTGLGLSLTYETIVGEHGGQIQVESQLHQYTEVIIALPKIIA